MMDLATMLMIGGLWLLLWYLIIEVRDRRRTQEIHEVVVDLSDLAVPASAVPEAIDEFDDGAVSSGVRSGHTFIGAMPVAKTTDGMRRPAPPGLTVDQHRRNQTEAAGLRWPDFSPMGRVVSLTLVPEVDDDAATMHYDPIRKVSK